MKRSEARKICFITGTRAEYGLLSGLIKKVEKEINEMIEILDEAEDAGHKREKVVLYISFFGLFALAI